MTESLFSFRPMRIVEGRIHDPDYALEDREVESGSITVEFEDGNFAVFTARWHNDSTAGLYVAVGKAE